MINRRTLLKWMLTTPLALTMDVEKLLWIPNQSIVVPSQYVPLREIFYGGACGGGKTLTAYKIYEMERERILPHLKELFEKSSLFYASLAQKNFMEQR